MDLPCDRDPSPILISTRWLRPKSEWVSLFHDASQLPFLTASTIGWKTGIPRAVIRKRYLFWLRGLIVLAQLGYLRKYTTTWNNDDNLSIRNLLIGSALQVLGLKKLKSGRAKRQACLTKCCPKRMLAARKGLPGFR
ncbi:hypothetical protein DN752_01015 [Echinicola strongylocentroti]|uniref:Uncharacterized protein n=1 Tax=Echinicola strongylocentroti TaxID=1795355 RepID=A0A2Z4ID88_9BACT|nr:hypothetical protein DN752_01015 [Echinicola strongylocentroti]